jgi:hypothetical protein
MSHPSLTRQAVRYVYVTPVSQTAGGALRICHTRHSYGKRRSRLISPFGQLWLWAPSLDARDASISITYAFTYPRHCGVETHTMGGALRIGNIQSTLGNIWPTLGNIPFISVNIQNLPQGLPHPWRQMPGTRSWSSRQQTRKAHRAPAQSRLCTAQ